MNDVFKIRNVKYNFTNDFSFVTIDGQKQYPIYVPKGETVFLKTLKIRKMLHFQIKC